MLNVLLLVMLMKLVFIVQGASVLRGRMMVRLTLRRNLSTRAQDRFRARSLLKRLRLGTT